MCTFGLQASRSMQGATVKNASRWLVFLVALQLFRLLVGSLFELVPQEAYYVFYARHPPILAWCLALPARLHPPPPIAVRLVPFLFAAVTLAGALRLARRFVPDAPEPAVLL